MEFCRSTIFCCATALFLAGCAEVPKAPNIASAQVVDGGVPVSEPYRLAIGDEVSVRFRFDADLNDSETIGPDGSAVFNLISNVHLAGMTLDQANQVLNQKYRDEAKLRDPQVTVSIKTYALQQIYVTGQVASPGVERSSIPLTASRVIALAGGFKTYSAETHNVLLIRRRPDGSAVYYQLDMGVTGVTPGQDPILQSYDMIFVPQTKIASVADFVSNNLLKILPVSASISTSRGF